MLCLRILEVDGDGSETSDDVFDKYKELFNNSELDISEARFDRGHRLGKKIPGRVRPIIVRFTTWHHRSTFDLTKTRMDILKEATDEARKSDHIGYAFANINRSFCVKLSKGLFKFSNTIEDLSNL